ncbi:MAG TPA: ATP-binding protein [Ktedonobacteraceae bacterium]
MINEFNPALQELLLKGASIVEPRQIYKARNYVTCVCAEDIDSDGNIEIIAGAADGRISVLTSECECLWSHIVGIKSPINTISILSHATETRTDYYIVAGTDNGSIYVFDKQGQAIPKERFSSPSLDASPPQEEFTQLWFHCGQPINQVHVTPEIHPNIIVASEDCHIYALSGNNGNRLWSFPTDGWARCVLSYDLNNDGAIEILASTSNRYIYILDRNGHKMRELHMEHSIRALCVGDINLDGVPELLVSTDKRELMALTPDFELLWVIPTFPNRLRAIHIADIDRDNANEIITGGDDKHLYILNQEGKILWRHFLGARITSLYASDIDGDGIQEIIIGADDERVHTLYVNLGRAKEGLYEQLQKAYQVFATRSVDLPTWLLPSERELIRDIANHGQEESIRLEHAEMLLSHRRFQEALAAFLRIEQQKMQPLWQKEIGYETRMLCFGNRLGDVIVGTTNGVFRAYDIQGQDLWSYDLPEHIHSAQSGYFQDSGQEGILACSTKHHIYQLGYPLEDGGDKGSACPEVLKQYPINDTFSICSLAFKTTDGKTEVLLGSENDQALYIYHNGLETAPEQISLEQSARILQFYSSEEQKPDDTPDIIVARTDQYVAAYSYTAKDALWKYKITKRIRSIITHDIDGDNHNEIIVGSEDRNIHVIDDQGFLKWRYYLPYSVLSTHVIDIDQDGCQEILAGCADGYLYVFNQEGDLLWKYQVGERITVIASKISERGVEIALGTDNRVEMLRMADPAYLQIAIERCWQGLIQKQSSTQVVKRLLQSTTEPALRAFAFKQASYLLTSEDDKLELFTQFSKDSSVEVRKVLAHALMDFYPLDPTTARPLLEKLSKDQEREIKLALVENMDKLAQHDLSIAFEYLGRFLENPDRFVRRSVMRRLYSLINDRREHSQTQMFQILLRGACDPKSVWVCQEAARTLAHFLDNHCGDLLPAMYFILTRDIKDQIILDMAHHVTNTTIRDILLASVQMKQAVLDKENAASRLDNAIQALYRIQHTQFAEDTWLLFQELHILFKMQTLEEIAQYRCQLKTHQSGLDNPHFISARRVFESIPSFTRLLKIYLVRQNVKDRISSLQEASRAIDRLSHFLDNEYQIVLEGEPLTKLPDYRFFTFLFKQWREMIQTILNDLRGKPKMNADLLTKSTRYEPFVTVLLNIQNIGHSPAYSVRVALLHSEDFAVCAPVVVQTDILFSQETLRAEFTLKFGAHRENVTLQIEITYDDGESEFCKEIVIEHLALRLMEEREYEFIPNPYSTGAPVIDNSMFFGREHDVAKLKTELALNTAQRIIVLHGLRRSGKTSLLRHLASNDILDNCSAIYLDLQTMIHEMTISSLFFSIGYEIQRTVKRKTQIILPLPEKSAFKDEPTFTFDVFLDEVETTLSKHRLVILIDEFEILQEQAQEGRLPATFFRYLRGLMQGRRMNFLLAGTHRLEQLTKDYWAVFYNFALLHHLSKISSEGATSLITVPTSQHLTYDHFAIEKIHQLTGDQPFLLNNLCRILVDHCNDLRKTYVTLHDVNALLSSAVAINSIPFNSLWQQIPPEEQSVMAMIAQTSHERPFTFTEIENFAKTEHIPFEQWQLRDVLSSLTQQDLLENVVLEEDAEQIRYRIPIGLLKTWINLERPLSLFKQQIRGSDHKA